MVFIVFIVFVNSYHSISFLSTRESCALSTWSKAHRRKTVIGDVGGWKSENEKGEDAKSEDSDLMIGEREIMIGGSFKYARR